MKSIWNAIIDGFALMAKTFGGFFCLMILAGCSTAQMIKETDHGGRVLVLGSRSIAAESGREKAKVMMQSKCPSGYKVIETGQQTTGASILGDQAINDTNLYYEFVCSGGK